MHSIKNLTVIAARARVRTATTNLRSFFDSTSVRSPGKVDNVCVRSLHTSSKKLNQVKSKQTNGIRASSSTAATNRKALYESQAQVEPDLETSNSNFPASWSAQQQRQQWQLEKKEEKEHQKQFEHQANVQQQQQSARAEQALPVTRAKNETLESHDFSLRHIGPRLNDQIEMLAALGYNSLDQLIDATIPEHIRMKRQLSLPEPMNEQELIYELTQLAQLNTAPEWKSYIGMGYYDCITPPVIARNMLESAGWTSAYTAYQAEISQGRLEALLNYQTLIAELTGLHMANASLLDEATAAAEAMQMCIRHHKNKRTKFLVSSRCHPQTLAVIKTRADGLNIQIDYFDEIHLGSSLPENLNEYCGVFVQYPNTQGSVYDLGEITNVAHSNNCLVVAATDLLACTIIKPPGDFENPVDIAIGSSQRFGVPLNYGGPHAAFMACQLALVRLLPGRVVGVTRDSNGDNAYRFALQTREQHIRRDKATSNICTAQALLANISSMYAVYHGANGLKEIATKIHRHTQQLKLGLAHNPHWKPINGSSYFDTLTFKCQDSKEFEKLRTRAYETKINLRYYDDNHHVGVSLDETTRDQDVAKLISIFSAINLTTPNNLIKQNLQDIECKLPERTSKFLEHPTFTQHRSETQLLRYMKKLENKDISLIHSMIPLGSCTMKLNASVELASMSWPQFTRCHPFQPIEQCAGYQKLFDQLCEYLCEISGYDRVSLQPNSGAQGEYAGLRCIKSYLESIGQAHRDVCLIPISAHGTNPASAQMAGFKIETLKVKSDGSVDMEDVIEKIERYGDKLACLMITYPSTFGVFESGIREICERVHNAGGQVYLDGANLNAQVGLCRPGDYGSDVSHFNLHKTFCIPHGGGGPGAGPIGVKNHLAPFLPGHPLVDVTGTAEKPFGTVSASHWGSPAILPISWSYIRLMGHKLKQSSQVAILNANYMKQRLSNDYSILFAGSNGNVAHEFIIDCRPFKKSTNIEAVDIAKRLQDFGLHAPTVSFPIANTLMIEPTESEDRQQLENYCEALLAIRREIQMIEDGKFDKIDNPIKNAPHTQKVVCSSNWTHSYTREQAAYPAKFVSSTIKIWPTVGRVDDTYGDTNLFCSCPSTESTSSTTTSDTQKK